MATNVAMGCRTERGRARSTGSPRPGVAEPWVPWPAVAGRMLSLPRPAAGEQRGQAGVFLCAGGAAAQVGGHARHGGLGICTVELQVDVAVQLVEADLAGDLRPAGAEQTAQYGRESRV